MIRQALLSLLVADSKYGYQLKSEFEDATGTAWVLNIGQVYNTLGRMERDGVITGLGEDGEGRPLYEITIAGRAELDEWLGEAVERSTSTRDEVIMKVLMAAATGAAPTRDVIAVQRSAAMSLLQLTTTARSSASSVADRLHLERLIMVTNAELQWLDVAEEAMVERSRFDDPSPGSQGRAGTEPGRSLGQQA